jgi:hypothetical protein
MTLFYGIKTSRCYKATVNESETITEAKPVSYESQPFGVRFPAPPLLDRS